MCVISSATFLLEGVILAFSYLFLLLLHRYLIKLPFDSLNIAKEITHTRLGRISSLQDVALLRSVQPTNKWSPLLQYPPPAARQNEDSSRINLFSSPV